MTPTTRALAYWLLRVGIAALLVIFIAAYSGPDPMLWWLWAGYAVLSFGVTLVLIRRGK